MKSNLKLFGKSILETLSDKQKRVIEQYETSSKLRGVMRWKERMARKNITSSQIAKDVGITVQRLSEYTNFKRQPQHDKYLKIESAIYKREG